MSQFLNVLLQVLVVRSHDLLQEDIVNAVYNMASVDFALFYNKFIPAFLQEVNTIDYHQKETLKRNLNPEHKVLYILLLFIHSVCNLHCIWLMTIILPIIYCIHCCSPSPGLELM